MELFHFYFPCKCFCYTIWTASCIHFVFWVCCLLHVVICLDVGGAIYFGSVCSCSVLGQLEGVIV